ncbi:4-hydroxyphenylpyruvate dioxygenase-like [Euphorbia lathyris]|uniref:4-hydroxyphenylpyruvate dioxygenase-like n=1 Tax=Euphorbia lathyris TaxID=212925 RepID=UPI003313DC1B
MEKLNDTIANFVKITPRSDRFTVKRFHHVEFWCSDATNTAHRFSWGLGMPLVAKSDLSTGNFTHASYFIRSGDLNFLFTAPYSPSVAAMENLSDTATASIPTFSREAFLKFSTKHGLNARAIAIEVEDAAIAFNTSVAQGAIPVAGPILLDNINRACIAEVQLYGDVVLRYVSYLSPNCLFLPKFQAVNEASPSSFPLDYGIRRLDHAVGNVAELAPAVSYVKQFTGFHEFAEFTAEEVGTVESGLNTVILANNEETVLLAMNEAVFGTKRKSQIQRYLEHNEGAGVQHLAVASEDIFRTLREMRKRSEIGGFEFMPSPPATYSRNLKKRAGDILSDEQIKECEELRILVDRDDEGTLLQIFTTLVFGPPTIFIEIIQKVGCVLKDETGREYQKGGCGGFFNLYHFGKGNFSELFKCIEEYEKILESSRTAQAV